MADPVAIAVSPLPFLTKKGSRPTKIQSHPLSSDEDATEMDKHRNSSDEERIWFLLYRKEKGSYLFSFCAYLTGLGSYLFWFVAYLFVLGSYLFPSDKEETKKGKLQNEKGKAGNFASEARDENPETGKQRGRPQTKMGEEKNQCRSPPREAQCSKRPFDNAGYLFGRNPRNSKI